jgi:hypothetical protein
MNFFSNLFNHGFLEPATDPFHVFFGRTGDLASANLRFFSIGKELEKLKSSLFKTNLALIMGGTVLAVKQFLDNKQLVKRVETLEHEAISRLYEHPPAQPQERRTAPVLPLSPYQPVPLLPRATL